MLEKTFIDRVRKPNRMFYLRLPRAKSKIYAAIIEQI
jgi:hypothetical protein